ncbi:MAG: xanthine dehydrogenase family protein molybdopterin-binding subunit [Burkholderiales bacterium]|nr:xanthine dehydrogenase family protein molybdopterin-binding subunit [Burkholderiales bacterium]
MKSLQHTPINRRGFLQVSASATAALSLGFSLPAHTQAKQPQEVNAWIDIHTDESIVIRYARTEMGQGSRTSAPMLIAEELEVDWKKVRIEDVQAHDNLKRKRAYGDMASVGSRTIRNSQDYLRKAGASARMMLVQAAAQRWGVAESECQAVLGKVVHTASKKSLSYGQLAADAAKLTPPKDVALKDPSTWTIAGKSIPRVDIHDIVTGKIRFGVDTQLPGMLHAAIAQSPVFGSKAVSIDTSKVDNRRGIVKVLNMGEFVVVVADNWWRAKEALRDVSIEWESSKYAQVNSAGLMKLYREGLSQTDAAVARQDGSALATLAQANKVIEAEYYTPYLAHATLEPMVCTAWLQDDQLQIWVSTQNPESSLTAAASTADVPQENVKVFAMQMGGGLGRKSPQDFTRQAVAIAKALPGKPIKLMWSREEDTQHDLYRPASLVKVRASLKPDGKPEALHIRVSAPSIFAQLLRMPLQNGVDPQAVAGLNDHPYDIAHCLVDFAQRSAHVPVGFWRTVGHSQNPFVRECFLDELATAAGTDPLAYRLSLLPNNEKANRDRGILQAVAKAADWDKPLPAGVFRGIAETDGYGSYTACVCEVSVNAKSEVRIHRIVIGIDPGYAVNPDNIQAQLQGSVVHGLSAIFWGEMTVKDGRIEQSNFHDYRLMRMNEMPKVQTVIAASGGFWGGVGEPAQAPLAPALGNALFAATGKRFRSLPLKNHGLSLVKA